MERRGKWRYRPCNEAHQQPLQEQSPPNEERSSPIMVTITNIAKFFFHACETGGGWEACKAYCAPSASFSAQADALAKVKTLQEYTDWMKGLLTFVPNVRYEIKSFATD
jgi:hypothetical protein